MRALPDLNSLQQFAEQCLVAWPNGGVVALEGELGAGKTTFVRLFIEALCKKTSQPVPRIISPTFVLHQSYDLNPCVEHFDWYRLEKVSEQQLVEIGFWDAVERAESQKGYVFVEWPSRWSTQAPVFTHTLRFSVSAEGAHFLETF